MPDNPLELTSWDVTRLYGDGYADQAQQLARYLRETESGNPSGDTPAEAWVNCPHCGSGDAVVEIRDGEVVFECLRCSETGIYGRGR